MQAHHTTHAAGSIYICNLHCIPTCQDAGGLLEPMARRCKFLGTLIIPVATTPDDDCKMLAPAAASRVPEGAKTQVEKEL